MNDVVIGVGELDQLRGRAGRPVLDYDGNATRVRPVPGQIIKRDMKVSDARQNRERRWIGVPAWAAVAHALSDRGVHTDASSSATTR